MEQVQKKTVSINTNASKTNKQTNKEIKHGHEHSGKTITAQKRVAGREREEEAQTGSSSTLNPIGSF